MTLLDVYRAGKPERALALPAHPGNPVCPIGRSLQRRLDLIFQEAEAAMEQKLASITVADVVAAIRSGEIDRLPVVVAP